MRPPQDWRRARVTLAIAGLIAAAWLAATLFSGQAEATVIGGFIPGRVGGVPFDDVPSPVWITPLTATLVHAGFLHLAFNLLVHLFCGRTIENIIGGKGLAILFVAGAYAAAAVHWLANPADLWPMVGASGAVSAEIGAYALLFGRNRSRIADPRLALLMHALWLGAAWVVLQAMVGYAFNFEVPTIAWVGSIGGFLIGLLLAKPLLLLRWRGA